MTQPQVGALARPSRQADVRITVHRLFGEPRDFTLSYPLDPDHDATLATIYREFGGRGGREGQVIEDRMHPRLPRATPGAPAGWLALASIRDTYRGGDARRWRLSHWPGSGPGRHDVPSLMHPDHAEGQEYVALRIEEHGDGFRSDLEKSAAKGTRSDVLAYDRTGRVAATFEIQNADLSSGLAMRRDRAVERAGIPATWFGPTDSRPAWAAKVAWMGANRREGVARGSWTVASGRRAIEMEACRPGARQDCPLGRNWCGDVHPLWRPRGGTVDDLVHGILGGDLQRFDTGKGIVVATPADCQRWVDYFGAPKIAKRASAVARRRSVEASIGHNDAYPEAKLFAALQPPEERDVAPVCLACSRPDWTAVAVGTCMACRAATPAAAIQLPPVKSVTGKDWALRTAERAAVDLVGSMRTYDDLLDLWRLAKNAGSATSQLLDACRQRKAEIMDGGLI